MIQPDPALEQKVEQLTRLTLALTGELEQQRHLLLAAQDEIHRLRGFASPPGYQDQEEARSTLQPQQAPKALRLSELRFDSLANALAEGVVLHDADGTILD
ncbi:MAG: domain S-box protein, partial [Polaromonas sp.]|nr:domain S-box protein [Polaromonas sp.]